MKINLPENVKFIIHTLEEAGFEAYAVGGCVRDSILGRQPNDWDITTSALPLETKALFKRTFDTGIKHGTVSVLINKDIYEVTTYRVDGEYEDLRHPKDVTFTSNLKEDLMRRDFTVNAMAYNDITGLVDLYGGLDDIKKRMIRCVGNPYDRFNEDALRILRAIRFAAQLDYDIEEDTKTAIKDLRNNLSKISAERIQVEFLKMVMSDNPGFIREAYELGVTQVFMPELDEMMECCQNNKNHAFTVGEHCIRVMENLPKDKVLRLAGLFHDIGKPRVKTTDDKGIDHFKTHPCVGADMTRDILSRLKFDNDTKDKVCVYVRNHDCQISITEDEKAVRRIMNKVGPEFFPSLFEFAVSDVLAQSEFNREEKLAHIDKLIKISCKIKEKKQAVVLKDLCISGRDLINEGFEAGPGLGKVLCELLEEVIDDPSKNDREYLLNRAKTMGV